MIGKTPSLLAEDSHWSIDKEKKLYREPQSGKIRAPISVHWMADRLRAMQNAQPDRVWRYSKPIMFFQT